MRLALGGPLLLLLFRPQRIPHAARLPLLAASLAVALYQPAFFWGVAANGVAIGTLVALGSAPFFAAALELLLDRRTPSAAWAVATLCTLAGLALLLLTSAEYRLTVTGAAASAAAGFAYASFVQATRRCRARGLTPQRTVGIAFTLGALLLAPTLLWLTPSWVASLRGFAVLVHLGLVATCLAYALFARGVAHTSAASTATLSLAEPLTASLLALFLVGETLAPPQLAGAGLLLVGLALLAIRERASPLEETG